MNRNNLKCLKDFDLITKWNEILKWKVRNIDHKMNNKTNCSKGL